jgi:hypothetical protein
MWSATHICGRSICATYLCSASLWSNILPSYQSSSLWEESACRLVFMSLRLRGFAKSSGAGSSSRVITDTARLLSIIFGALMDLMVMGVKTVSSLIFPGNSCNVNYDSYFQKRNCYPVVGILASSWLGWCPRGSPLSRVTFFSLTQTDFCEHEECRPLFFVESVLGGRS